MLLKNAFFDVSSCCTIYISSGKNANDHVGCVPEPFGSPSASGTALPVRQQLSRGRKPSRRTSSFTSSPTARPSAPPSWTTYEAFQTTTLGQIQPSPARQRLQRTDAGLPGQSRPGLCLDFQIDIGLGPGMSSATVLPSSRYWHTAPLFHSSLTVRIE